MQFSLQIKDLSIALIFFSDSAFLEMTSVVFHLENTYAYPHFAEDDYSIVLKDKVTSSLPPSKENIADVFVL